MNEVNFKIFNVAVIELRFLSLIQDVAGSKTCFIKIKFTKFTESQFRKPPMIPSNAANLMIYFPKILVSNKNSELAANAKTSSKQCMISFQVRVNICCTFTLRVCSIA